MKSRPVVYDRIYQFFLHRSLATRLATGHPIHLGQTHRRSGASQAAGGILGDSHSKDIMVGGSIMKSEIGGFNICFFPQTALELNGVLNFSKKQALFHHHFLIPAKVPGLVSLLFWHPVPSSFSGSG